MAVNQYIGARYVPLFYGEWVRNTTYEPLTVVEYAGNSYTSKQYVPKNVEITNTDYWAPTGNYNAQVEQYRRETRAAIELLERTYENTINTINAINTGASFNVMADGTVRVSF